MFKSAADIDAIIANAPSIDKTMQIKAVARQNELTKPQGSLGKLEEVAIWMAGWQRTDRPKIRHGQCLIFAGNHGVVAQGISPFPSAVTAQMVKNFENGGAAINQLCELADLKLCVTALKLGIPTMDITKGPALTETEVLESMSVGAAAIQNKCDYLILGEMGIGNTTSAAALCLGRFGGDAKGWVGPGTGLDDKGVAHKASVIESAVKIQQHSGGHTIALLAAFGGRELAAIAGAVLAARNRSIPVMLDGFVATAAAAMLTVDDKFDILDHTMISHMSSEPGHSRLAITLKKPPIVDLKMRLGEGSGGAVASLLVRAACVTHNGMSTFSEAGVSEA